jgi:hypothetical protein
MSNQEMIDVMQHFDLSIHHLQTSAMTNEECCFTSLLGRTFRNFKTVLTGMLPSMLNSMLIGSLVCMVFWFHMLQLPWMVAGLTSYISIGPISSSLMELTNVAPVLMAPNVLLPGSMSSSRPMPPVLLGLTVLWVKSRAAFMPCHPKIF